MISCLFKTTGLVNPNNVCPLDVPSSTVTCLSQLPVACSVLRNNNGMALQPLLATCKLALSGYGPEAINACLDPRKIGYGSQGQDVVNCLSEALPKVCLTTLPPSCTTLSGLTATDLTKLVPQCVTDLGPFVNDGVSSCAAGNPASGQAFIDCVRKSVSHGSGEGRLGSSPVVPGTTDIPRVTPEVKSPEVSLIPGPGGIYNGGYNKGSGGISNGGYNNGPGGISNGGYKKGSDEIVKGGYNKGSGEIPKDGFREGPKTSPKKHSKSHHGKSSDSNSLSHFEAGSRKSSSDFWWKFNKWAWDTWHSKPKGSSPGKGSQKEKGM
ncbi:hypothetical protein E4U42_004689 [Claviceps africana]|uniref:Uncharacterized protein n=1 Tax=Claviceps africana TaxID=83212 RepID=A0A8K0NHX2_9HYPO|nr:hypothetical protein E4U42_004689 [Claviceps africana]